MRTVYEALLGAALADVRGLVPAYTSVLVEIDPACAGSRAIEESVRALLRDTPEPGDEGVAASRRVEIPVCYQGDDFAPDLGELASLLGLTEEEVVRRHSAPEYLVHFLGFMPGFPYLGGLDPSLAAPRLSTPRVRVPAGSIAIGGSQTGVYPFATPGGWRILGRTPLVLYDPGRNPRALLRMGDHVRFVPIPRDRLVATHGVRP